MKRFSEQLNKKSLSVKLQAAEKNELRERLVSYMEYHPLPATLSTTKSFTKKAAASPFLTEAFSTVSFPFSILFKTSAVAAALVLVVIPFVAEYTVPGDTLYAVKVQFNEELRSTLTFDSYQKVEWETERLNRRIAEARLLANEGRLTEEVEAEVALAVRTHTENAQKEIEVLRSLDADEAAIATIALDTTLKVQSNSLRGEASEEGGYAMDVVDVRPTGLIANMLDQSLSESEAKNASSSLPAYEKLMARLELNTTRVYELLGSLKVTTDSTELVDVTRRIQDIERTIQEAVELHEFDDAGARTVLVDALQRTQRLIVFMTELQMEQTVDIEALVPVVLTKDEERDVATEVSIQLTKKIEQITTSTASTSDAAVVEKAQVGLASIKSLMQKMASSTEYAQFKSLSLEATTLADDTIMLLEMTREAKNNPKPAAEDNVIIKKPVTASTTLPDSVDEVGATVSTGTVEI